MFWTFIFGSKLKDKPKDKLWKEKKYLSFTLNVSVSPTAPLLAIESRVLRTLSLNYISNLNEYLKYSFIFARQE